MRRITLFLFFILISLFLSSCGTKKTSVTPTNEGEVYYEIFVRSFADSNGDGIGDLNGVTQSLDDLQDLGVTGLWLMPVFPSPSDHGYDVTNYEDINPDYGSLADMDNLISELHQRKMKLMLDFVINHSSTKHPWFIAAKDAASTTRSYYRFKENTESKTGPWYSNSINGGKATDFYYAYFWDQMPDLNYDHQEVKDLMIDQATFWLKKGVDAFRFDAAMHIFTADELYNQTKPQLTANIDFWKDYRTGLRQENKAVYTVGEVWTSESTVASFYQGLDSCFNFDLAAKIITTAKSLGNLYYTKQIQTMEDNIKAQSSTGIDAPFLSNHDQVRVMSQLNGDITLAKFAAEMMLTQAGNPFIYYGEELGMKGINPPDEDVRSPYLWGADDSRNTTWYTQTKPYNSDVASLLSQKEDENSLYNTYKSLIHLRAQNPALSKGTFQYVPTTVAAIQMFMRLDEADKQAIMVIHNFGKSEVIYDFLSTGFELLYQSQGNANEPNNTFASKSTKIFQIPYDSIQSYMPT